MTCCSRTLSPILPSPLPDTAVDLRTFLPPLLHPLLLYPTYWSAVWHLTRPSLDLFYCLSKLTGKNYEESCWLFLQNTSDINPFLTTLQGQKNNFPSTVLSSFGWTNNQINITRDNDKLCHVCTYRVSIRVWDQKTHWAVGAYVPFWNKEGEWSRGLGFQRKSRQFIGRWEEANKHVVNRFLLGHSNNVTEGSLMLVWILPVCHLINIC